MREGMLIDLPGLTDVTFDPALDDAAELLRWAMAFEPTLPAEFEFAIMGTTPTLPDGRTVHDGTALMVTCMVLMDDDVAGAAIDRLDECPVIDRALHREGARRADFGDLYDGPDAVEPGGVAGPSTTCGP